MDMTARQYCAARRSQCFNNQHGSQWKKCRGYVVVTDEYDYVKNGHIFAIEIHDNKPAIYCYTRKNCSEFRAYSRKSLQNMLTDATQWDREMLSHADMLSRIIAIYSDISTPTAAQFAAEYGIKYDKYNNQYINYISACDDI